jgi:dethiobiotin synthetase
MTALPARPLGLVGVVGTATEVGKTWVTARLIEELRRRDIAVQVRKPAQSFEDPPTEPTDAVVLGAASGERPATVCPEHRWYRVAMAPPMAAAVLGRPVPTLADLLEELVWSSPVADIGFVEAVGGVRSPIAEDGDSRAFVLSLDPDVVVLVAHAGLGVIDAVRGALEGIGASVEVIVVLNHFDGRDDLHIRNLAWLVERDGLTPVTQIDALADRVIATLNR